MRRRRRPSTAGFSRGRSRRPAGQAATGTGSPGAEAARPRWRPKACITARCARAWLPR
ncbi:MAG: hypothetical protein ACK55I_41945 [bacterium]